MRRTQTAQVRRLANLAEKNRDLQLELAEPELAGANLDDVAGRARRLAEGAYKFGTEASLLAAGGTKICLAHAARGDEAAAEAERLRGQILRAVEAEEVRREEAIHVRRAMLERDYPALAAVMASTGRSSLVNKAVRLVHADTYEEVENALAAWHVTPWDELSLPDPEVVTGFINEDTDARELAGVITAYAEACPFDLSPVLDGVSWGREAGGPLDEILTAAEGAGWRAPGEVYHEADERLSRGEAVPVHGGADDHDVAEAAILATTRYGILDDVHRPDDASVNWWAWFVPGVPVWEPHVQAWRRDMPVHDETLMLRQMHRADLEWDDWGQDTYLWAYADAYREAILDAEIPPTVGEEWDAGIDRADREAEAVERAEEAVARLDVSLSDLSFDTMVPEAGDIVACAESDARMDYREAHRRVVAPEGVAPLF